jgi:hypothetical protein
MSDDEKASLQLRITLLEREVSSLEKKLNEARRTICLDKCSRYSMPDHETWVREAQQVAQRKGWDCFDE